MQEEYALEYGSASIEIHKDALEKGSKVVIIDDLLATGGTAKAAASLLGKLDAIVAGYSFLIELSDLNGRRLLDGFDIQTLIKY
jgi:adenine phosphoribosyltransferase